MLLYGLTLEGNCMKISHLVHDQINAGVKHKAESSSVKKG